VTVDLGFAKKGRNFAADVGASLALIEKRRAKDGNDTEALNLVGNVEGRDVILVDDEIDTAGSVVKAVELLTRKGARDIFVVFVHAVFSDPALERLAALPVKKIVCTDTIEIPKAVTEELGNRLEVLSVAPLLGEVILRAHEGRSVGEMFNE
jgi:ribose-phosphate pyrophosphokinase